MMELELSPQADGRPTESSSRPLLHPPASSTLLSTHIHSGEVALKPVSPFRNSVPHSSPTPAFPYGFLTSPRETGHYNEEGEGQTPAWCLQGLVLCASIMKDGGESMHPLLPGRTVRLQREHLLRTLEVLSGNALCSFLCLDDTNTLPPTIQTLQLL
ncbi:hypothetical protein P7K49_033978 [Saguinus oedipus]|uniref:Uncharacterized protein n=1 Tax=Saguinus oedipus TaxID=9490 RepID=A0ABQ9TTW0_SAGOE|nr:hypothetical protein P7K49_033978 [Saguinus oedipus]